MKFTVKRIISAFIISLTLMTTTVLAKSTLMTYQGWAIRGKASIQNFTISSTTAITLTHTNDSFAYNYPGTDYMKITYQKKNSLGIYSNTSYSTTTHGTGTFTYNCSLSSGTYRLYFNTLDTGTSADISGNVKG